MKVIKYIIFICFFLFLIYSSNPSDNANNCYSSKAFYNQEFGGVVLDKFHDETQHSIPVILVRAPDSNSSKVSLFNEASGLFEDLLLNDSIRKEHGSYQMSIKRGKADILRTADFDCDSIALSNEPLVFNLYKIFK
jgi:hypothetical protein